MILRILRANHFYNFILVPLVGFLLLLGSLISGGTFPDASCVYTTPLCSPLMNSGISYSVAIMINYAAVLIMCFLLLQINARFSFVRERTFLPAFLFLFIVYALPELHVIQPIFIAGIFLTLAIRSIFSSFEKRRAISYAFDAGFFIGMSGIFFLPATLLITLVPISIFILRNKLEWRESFVPFMGLLLPWLFLFSFYYVFKDVDQLVELLNNALMFKEKLFLNNLAVQIFMGFLVLITIVSSTFILRQYDIKKISVRRYFKILFLFFISSVLLLSLPSVSSEILVLTTIPLTFLLTNYLIFVKHRIWAELFLTILIVLSIIIQYLM